MSCDFGPIPLPTSPLQTYFEEHYFSQTSTANQSRSAPVTKPEKSNIAPELMNALEKLAEERRKEDEDDDKAEQVPQIRVRKSATHRRDLSFGQRLLSGGMDLWSSLAGEQGQGAVQKVRIIFAPLCGY